MPYVYSTSSNDQLYRVYGKPAVDGQPSPVEHEVFVKGKANIADKHFWTPRGVVTEITNEQKDILLSCPAFCDHVQAGYMTIEEKKADSVESVAAALQGRDESAPLTDNDFLAKGEKPAVTNKKGG